MADDRSNLFSSLLPEVNPAACGRDIEAAFLELQACCFGGVKCLWWNDQYVAAALSVQIDLPSRGPVGGVDIRAKEPILLLFHKRDYPEQAPLALSDRRDFPDSQLPHLNPVPPGQPASFCLHRGDFNDWFAEHTLAVLVTRIRGWLRDAAAGSLIPEGDYFEWTRLTEAYGSMIFAPSDFERWIARGWKTTSGKSGYGFLGAKVLDFDKQNPFRNGAFPVRILSFHPKEEDLSERSQQADQIKALEVDGGRDKRYCSGLVCYSSREQSVTQYIGRLPEDLRGLLELCRRYDIPLEAGIQDYVRRGLFSSGLIPVIIALHRPQSLIGSHSRIEPLCFVILARDSENGHELPPEDAHLFPFFHRHPLEPEMARDISGNKETFQPARMLLFGCGALGSKLALHRARAGQPALTGVDKNTLSPHNLVRHGLLADSIGLNKAVAIKRSIEELYDHIPTGQKPDAYAGSALDWLKGELRARLTEHSLLIDATASVMVSDALTRAQLPDQLKVARCGIADSGKVGLLCVEGPRRNPRIDDLNILVYDWAIEQPALEQWLRRDRRQQEQRFSLGFAEVPIGLGCSSATMKLPDEVVSLHAAHFSIAIRELVETSPEQNQGYLIINFQPESDQGLVSQRIPVDPVVILQAHGATDWQVRIHSMAVKEIRDRLSRATPNETGGLMIGAAHIKRRIIYVTRIVDAPPDSEGTRQWFRRGTRHLPQVVNRIHEASGGLLGFVGDWHTHPRGSGRISPTDVDAMQKTKRDFDSAGLPTFILIATHKGFRAYVSEPE